MIAPFDLFKTEADGSVKWLGVCADLNAAKSRVIELSLALPGEYFIFSQTSERKLFIKPDGQVSERPSSANSDNCLQTMGFLFHVFKLAQNGVPVFVEGAADLDAAISRVNALRESSSGDYVIVSQATGKRILFTSEGGIRQS